MNKVLFVATVAKKHINVFHLPFLKMFKENGWETSVCARNDFEGDTEPVIPNCDNYYDIPFERFPINLNNLKAYKKIKKLISENNYNIVHCHTPTGGLVARLASMKFRKKGVKVIYTAHGFHFYKGAPFINWLLYFPVEWICSFFTDTLITINKEDYIFAQKHMHAREVKYVPGVGVRTDRLDKTKTEKMRAELQIPEDAVVIISVGELNKNKNHELIIRAISKMENVYYIVAGKGELSDYLQNLINELNASDRIKLLGYRQDVGALIKISDIFAFPSYREGLPVSVMEAMYLGLPVVASDIRGVRDLIENGKNGFLCNPFDSASFCEKISLLAEDKKSCEEMGRANKEKVKDFGMEKVNDKVREIYGLM